MMTFYRSTHFTCIAALALLTATVALAGDVAPQRPVMSANIHLPKKAGAATQKVAEILAARLQEYAGVKLVTSRKADLHVYLGIKPGMGPEGFSISDGPRGGISIFGNDERGLLYGAGKFLHTSTFDGRGFTPSSWRGVSVPKLPVRGMYLATHFQNFYEEAPIEDVKRYIEDLSLWGVNSYLVWFGIDAYDGIEDPKAQPMLARLRALLKLVKDLGLNASLGCVANDGYKNSPVALRADSTLGHNGYTKTSFPFCNLGPELCPSKPGVLELELKYCQEKFDVFKNIGLDYWFIWPYDNGGCTCAKCAPWGVNGFLRMAEPEARAYRGAFPNGKVILGLWYFDKWRDGEWAGITEKFNQHKPDWVDYVMADDFGGTYPQYPLTHGTPGGLPMLNFPEISMYACHPWGGYGANPLPRYLQSLWDASKARLSGGFPYSEGIYEDANKVMVAQLYWNPETTTEAALREYIAFYFSPEAVAPISQAMLILEQNLARWRQEADGVTKIMMKKSDRAEETYRLVAETDGRLPARVRSSWRWRVVYLRALIDAELAKHENKVSRKCLAAFQELTTIYHAQNAKPTLRPPTDAVGVVE